jgi:glutathione S-transferase
LGAIDYRNIVGRHERVIQEGFMAAQSVQIIGSFLSPYVRKVLVALEMKGVPYDVDPIVPFFGNDEFGRMSPLRRIPVLIDAAVTLCDSTVIFEYIEERYPRPALLPNDVARRARARWLEEFADTRMGDVLIWHYYSQLVVRRIVWGELPDEEVVRKAREEEIPAILNYLESQVPENEFLFGPVSIADISVASFFRNASYARYAIDQVRWPKTSALVARTLALPAFEKLKRYEDATLGTPVAERRSRLLAAGAPLAASTLATGTPRRGVMAI